MKKKITKVLCTKSNNIRTPKKVTRLLDNNDIDLLSYTDDTIIHILNNKINDTILTQTTKLIEKGEINILIVYLYLENNKKEINEEILDKINLYLYKVYETSDYENELLTRILKNINEYCQVNDNLKHDKLFYLTLSYLLKRRVLSSSTRIKAFDLMLTLCKENLTYLKELVNEYDNIDNFRLRNMQFNNYVIIKLLHRIYNANEKNLTSIETYIDDFTINNEKTVVKLTKAASESLQDTESRTFVMFILSRSLSHENGIIKYLDAVTHIITYLQTKQGSVFDTYIYKNLKCKDDSQIVKIICVNLFNYLKTKESKKYYALKCLKHMRFDFLNDNDKSAIISLMVYLFRNSKNKLKELIIEVLDNLGHTKLFHLLEGNTESDSIMLKKKTFLIMLKYLNKKEKHKDIVLAYINFLKDKDMKDYVLTHFDWNADWSIYNKDSNTEEQKLSEQENYYNKLNFIDVFTQYVYFEYNKEFLDRLNVPIALFVPKDCNIYRIIFLKHYAKYNSESFCDIQLDLISSICNNQNNTNFVLNVYKIFAILLDKNSFNLYIKDSLIDVAVNGLSNMHTMGVCGKMLQKLNYNVAMRENDNSLVYAALGHEVYIQNFDYNFHDINKIIGYLLYIESANYKHKNNGMHISTIINMLEKVVHDTTYNECHKALVVHIKEMLDRPKSDIHNPQPYHNIISSKQQYFYNLLLNNDKDYSFMAQKLVLRVLDAKLILPHSSVGYILFFFTFNYNNYVKNIITLYTHEIINYIEIYIDHVIKYIERTKTIITKQNLMLYFIFTYIKSDKLKIKFVTKVFKLCENINHLSLHIILLNLSQCNLTRKVKKVILELVDLQVNNLELCFENTDTKNAINMHLLCAYKKALKNKKGYRIGYGDILYRNDENELEELNHKLKYKLLQNK